MGKLPRTLYLMKPKFSIIIPVYNAKKFLERCIKSCINQSYSNIEIICVDDYSSDNSKSILTAFQEKDNRIKCIFHSKNKSQYTARRNGFLESTGDYILFLDSDDTLQSNACRLIAKEIEESNADIIQFGYREIPGNKEVFSPFYPSSKERIFWYLARENRYSPEVWTKAYKRLVISNAYNVMEIFYASGAEDVYTSIVFAYFAQTFSFLKKPLVNYSIDTGWSRRQEYSLQTYTSWLASYNTVIQKTAAFIAQYMPEYSPKCLDMEVYLLHDFLYNRLALDVSPLLKYQLFDLLPSYFSKKTIYTFFNETLFKAGKYNEYLDFNAPVKSKIKKMMKHFIYLVKSC